ncbi:MAG TPA: histidine phosphatase family protein [Beutenbergiaceae bacterium]|nr:histidine phosphatase family protein [Beutenbergiaceae bacterium]
MAEKRVPRQICLLRHGATAWNREGRFLGRGDRDLDERGAADLEVAAGQIAQFAPEAVVTSPARRVQQTLAALIRFGGLGQVSNHVEPDAWEVDFGVFEGRTRAEISASPDADAFDQWLRPEFGCPAAPGGESFDSAARRAARVLAGLPARRTLLISHGYFLKILLATCVDGGRAEDVRAEHLPNGVPILLTAHPVRGWRRSEPPAAKGERLE